MVGALIGKQKGRNIEVMNSFELVFSIIDGDVIIDRDYYNLKEEQCKFDYLLWRLYILTRGRPRPLYIDSSIK